jgi:hypothetical protein
MVFNLLSLAALTYESTIHFYNVLVLSLIFLRSLEISYTGQSSRPTCRYDTDTCALGEQDALDRASLKFQCDKHSASLGNSMVTIDVPQMGDATAYLLSPDGSKRSNLSVDLALDLILTSQESALSFASCKSVATEDPDESPSRSSVGGAKAGESSSQLQTQPEQLPFCFQSARIILSGSYMIGSQTSPESRERIADYFQKILGQSEYMDIQEEDGLQKELMAALGLDLEDDAVTGIDEMIFLTRIIEDPKDWLKGLNRKEIRGKLTMLQQVGYGDRTEEAKMYLRSWKMITLGKTRPSDISIDPSAEQEMIPI